MYFTGFVCVKCGAAYPPDQDLLLCAACQNLLEAQYDYARLGRELDRDALWRRPHTVWRWLELLPVRDPDKIVTLGEGALSSPDCSGIVPSARDSTTDCRVAHRRAQASNGAVAIPNNSSLQALRRKGRTHGEDDSRRDW